MNAGESHIYDDSADATCNVCAYVRTISSEPVIYIMTVGENLEVTAGEPATFTSDADFSKFLKVQIDGIDIDAAHYTAVAGSTKVTLKVEYIETLSVGEHTIAIVSTDGEAVAKFTVKAETPETGTEDTSDDNVGAEDVGAGENTPQTGDDSHIALWIILLCASELALIGTAVYSRKRKMN